MRAQELFRQLEIRRPGLRRAIAESEASVFLAVNLLRLRTARSLTQQELARRAGMRQPRIAELERGDGNPRLDTLVRLAGALGVPLEYLFSRPPSAGSVELRGRAVAATSCSRIVVQAKTRAARPPGDDSVPVVAIAEAFTAGQRLRSGQPSGDDG